MEIRELVERAFQRDLSDPSALSDAFDSIRLLEPEDFKLAHEKNKEVRRLSAKFAAEQKSLRMFELNKRSLLFDAPYDFDAFLRYLEWDRKPEKRFYLPRRHYLKKYVDAYQEILDGKLDFLSISMPKRAGKSQLGINFVNMLSGKFPDRATLMEGTGDDLVMSFYKGCLEYLQTPNEYLFYDVFPSSKLIQTNADSKTINLLNKSRFPTIMCRSIDARQVGLSEATNSLYLDDCVEGREEAKNRNRLDAKWEVISGDILGRAIEGTPVVICGTRYSLYDPIGRLQEEMRKQRKRMKIIETPALDLITDESNFEYTRDGKKVFTTQYFRDQREMLSAEQFESEFQQQPFEAKGLLFPENELNRYFELPVDREPDAIISVCDTAEGGGDSVMMPIGYIYGEDTFIEDCVFDNSTPEVTKPQCAKKLVEHKVSVATFESNNAGTYFARDVEELVKKMGGRVSIRTRRTISNKQTRIEMASDGILKHFYFKDKSLYKPSDQYGQMMRELVTYTRTGKVKHDDSPDGLSLLENEIRNLTWGKVEVFTRPF